MIRWLFILCIVFSCIPRAIFGEIDNPILSRITASDVFGALGIIGLFVTDYKTIITTLKEVKVYWAIGGLLIAFMISTLFSLNVYISIVEVLILIYLSCLCLGIYIVFKENFELLIQVIAITLCLSSFVAFYDTFAEALGIRKIFTHNRSGFVVGGFRTTGQAGVYCMTFIGVLIAYFNTTLFKTLSKNKKLLISGAIFFGSIFLLLTGKIGGLIGFGVGVLLFVLLSRKRSFIYYTALLFSLVAVGIFVSKWIVPEVYYRVSNKFTFYQELFLTSKIRTTKLYEGWSQALIAFNDHPLTGTGIGAFQGNYHSHEVHGGLFKILVETGIIGFLTYGLFIFVIVKTLLHYREQMSSWRGQFVKILIPFLIGFFVAWIYTYPLRKREFWILLSIILIVSCQSQTIKVKKRPKTP